MVHKQRRRGGVSLLENPRGAESWNTTELKALEKEEPDTGDGKHYELIPVDLCALGLKDVDSELPHKKPTYVGTDSPGIQSLFRGRRCKGGHRHQPLEGSNSGGRRTKQAAQWTEKFCKLIIQGVQKDVRHEVCDAFFSENVAEEMEEKPHTLDELYTEEDLPTSKPTSGEVEKGIQWEEGLEDITREDDPQCEKIRRAAWLKLSREERVGIRRLHVMTSHATKPQMQRMLRYSNAPASVVSGVRFFRCSACERNLTERKPSITKSPSPYIFGVELGLDIFDIKDAQGVRYQVLHAVCHGTTFQSGEVLGVTSGVPGSKQCLESFLRFWTMWAGV